MHNRSSCTRTIIALLLFAATAHTTIVAQSPLSFFPHHVGDLWQFRFYAGARLAWTERLDSMFVDTSGVKFFRYNRRYHDIIPYTQVGWYAIPDSVRLLEGVVPGTPVERMKLLYKLDAQLGEAWLVDSAGPQVAQLTDTGTTQIFGRQVHYIDIQYGYLNDFPDTVWWDVRSLATGFGLIYAQLEPMGPVGLAGAIIDSIQYGFIVSVPEPSVSPSSYRLHQNFPNPFNPSTMIKYQLAEDGVVELQVFDILGREVATIAKGFQSAGYYSATFTANKLASGVYFVRFTVNNETGRAVFTKMTKMALVR